MFVSTDVAARGIDVDDVDIVFNCDVPDENQDYVHRIGRTGRAKRQGVAVSLIADYPSKLRIDDIAAEDPQRDRPRPLQRRGAPGGHPVTHGPDPALPGPAFSVGKCDSVTKL